MELEFPLTEEDFRLTSDQKSSPPNLNLKSEIISCDNKENASISSTSPSKKRGRGSKLESSSYPCKECGKFYANKNSLNAHIKSIHRKQKISCPVCKKEFIWLSSYSTHKKTCHKESGFREQETLKSKRSLDTNESIPAKRLSTGTEMVQPVVAAPSNNMLDIVQGVSPTTSNFQSNPSDTIPLSNSTYNPHFSSKFANSFYGNEFVPNHQQQLQTNVFNYQYPVQAVQLPTQNSNLPNYTIPQSDTNIDLSFLKN